MTASVAWREIQTPISCGRSAPNAKLCLVRGGVRIGVAETARSEERVVGRLLYQLAEFRLGAELAL